MRFENFYEKYNENALIQERVAQTLLNLIKESSNCDKVLELGCGTGLFTKKILKNIPYKILDLNDIYDTKKYFSENDYRKYIIGDMENIDLESYSLIVSSSCFQWAKDLKLFLNKLSKSTDELAFSIYVDGNLKEIKEHFNISLNYFTTLEIQEELCKIYSKVHFYEEEFNLEFESPYLALKHLKYTGVTGIGKAKISEIKSFKSNFLTYKVAYYKCTK